MFTFTNSVLNVGSLSFETKDPQPCYSLK